jgi:hypothetical protein
MDIQNIENFGLVNRYQCREMTKANVLTSSVYDPIQSEDPHFNYPLDFYATNMGEALWKFGLADDSNSWACPQNPDTQTLFADGETTGRYSMRIYSVDPLPGGTKVIYPSDPMNDRYTFYLSKNKNGAFDRPVYAYKTPETAALIGWGASPVQTGPSTEKCPNAAKPDGYKWVKVWLFRANLPAKTFLSFSPAGFAKLGTVMCNPGYFYPDPVNPAFPGGAYQCQQSFDLKLGGQTAWGWVDNTSNPYILADRILGNGMCVRLSGAGVCGGGEGPGCFPGGNTVVRGADEWRDVSVNSCNLGFWGFDPVNVCTATNPGKQIGQQAVPYSTDIQITTTTTQLSFGFLFVVSPESVTKADMLCTAGGQCLGAQYTPYRYVSGLDCQAAANPDADATCIAAKERMITYGIKMHDVISNGDPPVDGRPESFPVCALQPQ